MWSCRMAHRWCSQGTGCSCGGSVHLSKCSHNTQHTYRRQHAHQGLQGMHSSSAVPEQPSQTSRIPRLTQRSFRLQVCTAQVNTYVPLQQCNAVSCTVQHPRLRAHCAAASSTPLSPLYERQQCLPEWRAQWRLQFLCHLRALQSPWSADWLRRLALVGRCGPVPPPSLNVQHVRKRHADLVMLTLHHASKY